MAAIDQQGLDALLHEPIIRNRSKIEACVANARQWAALARADGTYLARVARIAASDDPSAGWPDLLRALQQDFSRLGEATAGMTLKRWGFFMARAHPGARRLLQRLGFVRSEADGSELQQFVAALAQAGSRDPYAVEAALALFASLGPCDVEPKCGECVLNEKCPELEKRDISRAATLVRLRRARLAAFRGKCSSLTFRLRCR